MLNDAIMYRLRTVFEFHEHTVAISQLEGWLSDIQGYTLMVLAEQGPGLGAIVEIGSFKGKSTCWLAKGAMRACREKVYAIDSFTGSPEHQKGMENEDHDIVNSGSTLEAFKRNTSFLGVADHVETIVAKSEDAAAAWNKPIRLLFIDADHSYEASKRDFDLWSPHVIQGGLIAFHDIGAWEGVTDFYNQEVKSNPDYRELLNVMGLVVVERIV
ncbi:MAG: class I SAM-dependent methyltransferase [Candidatus Hydrogenedentes bacterium]|nr:class I SAM-dependent methyltransferase [Candidatus Hydrogenedentota bacterium]